jgi:peroxiredoxin
MRHPAVPESLDSWKILHRMFRFGHRAWQRVAPAERTEIETEAVALFRELAAGSDRDCGLAQLLGHKANLMLTHYARTFDELGEVQTRVDRLGLAGFLDEQSSYVSNLELGLYEATGRIHATLRERGLRPRSPEWNDAFDELVADEAANPRNAARLWAKIPRRRYVCFYPMDKKRGEMVNWYMLPYEERARLMVEHGKIGRTFAGLVTQVISGSTGFDDWEWGVDLYADDPLVFKKLVYEMRFDEASAKYGSFGRFFTGMQFSPVELPRFLNGDGSPQLLEKDVAREPALP